MSWDDVAAFDPSDPARARILDFWAAHPDALERTCRAGHLTGSALVVNAQRSAVLLVKHAKLGRWLQPGGHADGEPNLGAVALREASEETGVEGLTLRGLIDLDVHTIPFTHGGKPGTHLHLDARYLVVAPPGATVARNHESTAIAWFSPSALPDADPGLRRLISRGMACM